MKAICQLSILGTILILCTACPDFKSIQHPTYVFAGDTVSIKIKVYMRDSRPEYGYFTFHIPEGWALLSDTIYFEGISQPKQGLRFSDYDNEWIFRLNRENGDSVISKMVETEVKIINLRQNATSDTFFTSISDDNGWGWFYERKSFVINTHIDKKTPLYLRKENNLIKWDLPKQQDGLRGVTLFNNGKKIRTFSATNFYNNENLNGISRITYKANYEDGTEIFGKDTLVITQGNVLYVSTEGDDLNSGTALEPLRSLEKAMEYIEQDFILTEDKQIILRPGTYLYTGPNPDLQYSIPENNKLKDRISIIGEDPSNTWITGGNYGFLTEVINTGITLQNLSLIGFEKALQINTDFWSLGPTNTLKNVRIMDGEIGVYTKNGTLIIENSLFDLRGTGIIFDGGSNTIKIRNSNFVNSDEGIAFDQNRTINLDIINSIFYNNFSDINFRAGSQTPPDSMVHISHSIIQEDWHEYGDENFYEDPIFIDDDNFPYRLSQFSPAIDAGIDSIKYLDIEDESLPGNAAFPALGTTRNDLGIYGGGGKEKLVTGLSYRELIPYRVFPNPTTDYLEIEVENSYKLSKLQLVDLNGRLASNKTIEGRLDVRGIPPGIYLLRFNYENIQKTERVIIKG